MLCYVYRTSHLLLLSLSRIEAMLSAVWSAKSEALRSAKEGGVRVCGDAVLYNFWCGFAVICILTRGIAVSKH